MPFRCLIHFERSGTVNGLFHFFRRRRSAPEEVLRDTIRSKRQSLGECERELAKARKRADEVRQRIAWHNLRVQELEEELSDHKLSELSRTRLSEHLEWTKHRIRWSEQQQLDPAGKGSIAQEIERLTERRDRLQAEIAQFKEDLQKMRA